MPIAYKVSLEGLGASNGPSGSRRCTRPGFLPNMGGNIRVDLQAIPIFTVYVQSHE